MRFTAFASGKRLALLDSATYRGLSYPSSAWARTHLRELCFATPCEDFVLHPATPWEAELPGHAFPSGELGHEAPLGGGQFHDGEPKVFDRAYDGDELAHVHGFVDETIGV